MNTHYILRNKLTGLFFDGTNFSAESANTCARFADAPNEVAARSVWGTNTQIIAITDAQIAALNESDRLDARANEHKRRIGCSEARHAAPYLAAITRLRSRAAKLAFGVYSSFPRVGHYAP